MAWRKDNQNTVTDKVTPLQTEGAKSSSQAGVEPDVWVKSTNSTPSGKWEIRKYRMIQEIEITIYPNGAVFPKTIWQKIKDEDVTQANYQTNQKKKETAKNNAIQEAKEKAEKIEAQKYRNTGQEDM